MSKALKHAKVVFHVVLTIATLVLAFAQHVSKSLAANIAKFPKLPVNLADFAQQIEDLDTAIQEASPQEGGKVALRTPKLRAVVSSLRLIKAYVQSLCDALGHADGVALAVLAGFPTQEDVIRVKQLLAVAKGALPDTAKLVGNAKGLRGSLRGRIQYRWMMSADGGKSWVQKAITTESTTTVDGLSPKVDYLFNVYCTTKDATGQTSPTVTFSY